MTSRRLPRDDWEPSDGTRAEMRRYLEALHCPVCGQGPYPNPPVHIGIAHGNLDEIKDQAGIPYSRSLVSSDLRDLLQTTSRERVERDPGSIEAAYRASVENRAPMRSNDGTLEVQRANAARATAQRIRALPPSP